MPEDLLDVSSHFRFGENWANYSKLVDQRRVDAARDSVESLVGDLSGKTFLDAGSGSGLFSVAALQLGAKRVVAVDIDPDSVATTRKLLSASGKKNWRADQISIFDLPSQIKQRFDVVYSWGVLHHTGAMWDAIERASEMVEPNGLFALALYEKTLMCPAWVQEKRFYRRLPKLAQRAARSLFIGVWGAGMLARLQNPWRYVRESSTRGMDIGHDVHDWLGGYPYESTCPAEVLPFMDKLGFENLIVRPWRVRLAGLLGSGCSEYVFRKRASAPGESRGPRSSSQQLSESS